MAKGFTMAWLVALAFLMIGCTTPVTDASRRLAGVVTESRTTSQRADRPGIMPYALFGLLGALAYDEAVKVADTRVTFLNRSYVKTASGEIVVDWNEYFSPGTCLEIVPTANATSSSFFPFGSARVVRSDGC